MRAFERTAAQIDVLQPGKRQQFDDAEPDTAARLKHLRVDPITACLAGSRRIPVDHPAAKRRQQRPSEQRPEHVFQHGEADDEAGDQ